MVDLKFKLIKKLPKGETVVAMTMFMDKHLIIATNKRVFRYYPFTKRLVEITWKVIC